MTTRHLRASKRWMVAAAAVAVGASALVPTPMSAAVADFPDYDTLDPDTVRVGGDNRFGTAAGISEFVARWDGQTCEVIVANGLDFPDALTAASAKSPILLTRQDALPAETIAELDRIVDPTSADFCEDLDITIVGGTAVVSNNVGGELSAYGDVNRLAGDNRYETALDVAAETLGSGDTIIVATGQNFPDALAAGVLAGAGDPYPILLNDGPALRADVDQFIEDKGIKTAYIVGGTSVVPQSVENELKSIGVTVKRLAGNNRWETAVEIADHLIENFGSTYKMGVILANGTLPNFPDALAAAHAGYTFGTPLLLVESCNVPPATAGWHLANSDTLGSIGVVGGTAAVCNAVLEDAAAAASAVVPDIISATLEVELTQRVITLGHAAQGTARPAVDVVELTAVKGSAADGPAANAYAIDVIETPGVALSVELVTTDPMAPTFVVTVNELDGFTGAAFAKLWNDSDARGLLVAKAVGDAAFDDRVVKDPPDEVLGTAIVEIVTTYNRPVLLNTKDRPAFVYDRPGIAGTNILRLDPGTFPGSLTTDPLDDVTVVYTRVVDSWMDTIPQVGNDEVRVEAPVGALGSGLQNLGNADGEIIETLVAAP